MPSNKKRGTSSEGESAEAKKQKKKNYLGKGVYVAEAVIAAQKMKKQPGEWEYRVRWKGYKAHDDTWEPKHHLSEKLYQDGLRLHQPQAVSDLEEMFEHVENQEEETEDSDSSAGESTDGDEKQRASSNQEHVQDHWEWKDKELLQIRDIERININDPEAKRRVTDARLVGTPVCLVGHSGWPQFASRWLRPQGQPARAAAAFEKSATKSRENSVELGSHSAEPPKELATTTSNDGSHIGKVFPATQAGNDNALELPASADWLDLTKDWELDVDKMIDDIGDEVVPVIKKGYDERNPIHKRVPLKDFLLQCWPSKEADNTAADAAKQNLKSLYLHQWQFPLAESDATVKLCGPGNNNPLPNDILGEDLLCYWQDLEKCQGDNPFQYIFMGKSETLSKLHRDVGGLAITIAPIVGKKEVVLVHRADNACLYDCKASLDKIDLHKYPMLSHARIYKSVIEPGEMLLMPQGTFHQCRNVTPCLSYSRFHLDTVNLRAFLESMINMDAPEIEQEDVLWNATLGLENKVDAYVAEAKKKLKEDSLAATAGVPKEVIRWVDTLRQLRCIVREIGKRYEEGKLDVNRQPPGLGTDEDPFGPGIESDNKDAHSSADDNKKQAETYRNRVREMDLSLHDFRYRHHTVKPHFKSRSDPKQSSKLPPQRNLQPLEIELNKLTVVEASSLCLPESSILTTGNRVEVNWQGRRAEGRIQQIEDASFAPLVDYEDLPVAFSEFVPLKFLRMPVGGESTTEVRAESIVPGKVLVHQHGRQEYRCTVRSTSRGTFVSLRLQLGAMTVDRWLPRSAVLALKETSTN